MMDPFDASICIEQFGVTSQLAQRLVDRPKLAVVITRSRRKIKVYITRPGITFSPTLSKENLSEPLWSFFRDRLGLINITINMTIYAFSINITISAFSFQNNTHVNQITQQRHLVLE